MTDGTIFGVVLNDADEVARLAAAFTVPPYNAPPVAPVVYIKPRVCATTGGAAVPVPSDVHDFVISPTIGLVFSRTLAGRSKAALGSVGAMRLALDVSEPEADYYRPAIRQRCRDGWLPLGGIAPFEDAIGDAELTTIVYGQVVHRWTLSRLVRPIESLVDDLASFMTFEAGDTLLVGLPGDAPRVRRGARIEVRADGLPTLTTSIVGEGGL